MATFRLLRTKRQRRFLIAYLAWVATLFALYWYEPYAVPERWTSYRWLAGGPLIGFGLVYFRDVLGIVLDGYRGVSNWINRGA